MQKGDTIFYVNSGREIDRYTVDKIDQTQNKAFVSCSFDLSDTNNAIKTSFSITDFCMRKLPRLFDNYDDALALKQKLDDDYERQRQIRFDKILEEALNSITIDTVEKHGILLKEKKTEYEPYYSDAPGGCWYEAKLYQYEGKQYIIAYKCIDTPELKKECIKFCERN